MKALKILCSLAAIVSVASCQINLEPTACESIKGGDNSLFKLSVTTGDYPTETYLGDLEGEIRPMYWSTADRLSVNGNLSLPLGSESAGSASADFFFKSAPELARQNHSVYQLTNTYDERKNITSLRHSPVSGFECSAGTEHMFAV